MVINNKINNGNCLKIINYFIYIIFLLLGSSALNTKSSNNTVVTPVLNLQNPYYCNSIITSPNGT